eukprot:1579616-Rhodomonas_salina.2
MLAAPYPRRHSWTTSVTPGLDRAVAPLQRHLRGPARAIRRSIFSGTCLHMEWSSCWRSPRSLPAAGARTHWTPLGCARPRCRGWRHPARAAPLLSPSPRRSGLAAASR